MVDLRLSYEPSLLSYFFGCFSLISLLLLILAIILLMFWIVNKVLIKNKTEELKDKYEKRINKLESVSAKFLFIHWINYAIQNIYRMIFHHGLNFDMEIVLLILISISNIYFGFRFIRNKIKIKTCKQEDDENKYKEDLKKCNLLMIKFSIVMYFVFIIIVSF